MSEQKGPYERAMSGGERSNKQHFVDWSSPERQEFLEEMQEIAYLLASGYKFSEYQIFGDKEKDSPLKELQKTVLIKEGEEGGKPRIKTFLSKFPFPFNITEKGAEKDFQIALYEFKKTLVDKK